MDSGNSQENTDEDNTTPPTKPTEVKPINPNQIGNTGTLFATSEEAHTWAFEQMEYNWDNLKKQLGFSEIGGYGVSVVFITDDTQRYSVHFYE